MRIVCFEAPRRRGEGREPSPHALGAIARGLEELEALPVGVRRIGALIDAGDSRPSVVDLARAYAVKLALEDAGAPEAEAESLLPADPRAFLAHGASSLAAAHEALDFARESLERIDAPDLRGAGIVLPRSALRLHAPVGRPGKILGVARNYDDHARELGDAEPASEPVLFVKASSAVIGPEDEIRVPAAVRQPDYEGELAAVIGRRARDVDVEDALACVFGYCVANDVTARDYQNQRGQRFLGKSCDGFAPLGPALVTADEVPDVQDLGLVTRVSGEVMQSARTKDMRFPVAEVVAFASRLMTLEPGDVILTGTPAGVGAARTPPRWLRDGDLVEVEIERVGRLVNYVRTGA